MNEEGNRSVEYDAENNQSGDNHSVVGHDFALLKITVVKAIAY
jgi:hypothetical protein